MGKAENKISIAKFVKNLLCANITRVAFDSLNLVDKNRFKSSSLISCRKPALKSVLQLKKNNENSFFCGQNYVYSNIHKYRGIPGNKKNQAWSGKTDLCFSCSILCLFCPVDEYLARLARLILPNAARVVNCPSACW